MGIVGANRISSPEAKGTVAALVLLMVGCTGDTAERSRRLGPEPTMALSATIEFERYASADSVLVFAAEAVEQEVNEVVTSDLQGDSLVVGPYHFLGREDQAPIFARIRVSALQDGGVARVQIQAVSESVPVGPTRGGDPRMLELVERVHDHIQRRLSVNAR